MYSSNNPFRQLIVLDSQEHKLYKIFHLLHPYLSITDIISVSLLNSRFQQLANDIIWSEPDFKRLAYIHDSLYMFNKFLTHINSHTGQRVKRVNVAKMEESLYERVNASFFKTLVTHCSHLTHLDVSYTHFFQQQSLPEEWSLPYLTYLNVSYCPQVNDAMLVKLARGCRAQLRQVRLDGLTKHKGQGLACFAAECDRLTSVSVRYNTAMTDDALLALAKFRHVKLMELDLTGCNKLTDVGFDVLARYCAHLQYISLAQTACELAQIKKMQRCLTQFTKSLDVSDLKRCKADKLAAWMWESAMVFGQLVDVTIEMTVAIELVKQKHSREEENQLPLVDTTTHKDKNEEGFKTVKRLVLTNLQEHTPWSYFEKLLSLFPQVYYVTFKRAYFESDFMLGVYRTPSPEAEDSITDFKLQSFNHSQSKVIATVVREREDNLDCSLLNW